MSIQPRSMTGGPRQPPEGRSPGHPVPPPPPAVFQSAAGFRRLFACGACRALAPAFAAVVLLLGADRPARADGIPGSSYFPPTPLQRAASRGGLVVIPARPETPTLLPDVQERESLREELAALSPTAAVELLIREHFDQREFASPRGLLCLVNAMQSISTMEGITYYSASRRKTRTLFTESYVVRSPRDHTRIPDPFSSRIPPTRRLALVQNDTTFGRNLYEAEYAVHADHVRLAIRNLTTLRYAGLPVIRPRMLVFLFIVFPGDGEITLYAYAGARTTRLPLLRGAVATSFRNRILAVDRWLASRLRLCPTASGGSEHQP